MEALTGILLTTQLAFTVIAGLYFYTSLKAQRGSKATINTEGGREFENIKKLRNVKLNRPLSERTRPEKFPDIVGQEKGIKALKASLYGPNPQHVIIYGPPGIGKTAAARLVLENAARSQDSPFTADSPFIEIDATILQFDERSIADPLIGSVHDPIYQGAGALGQAGIPQPKPGAVTNAHGGVLFIDEIGELHQIQMNKLLKVLEDRKVTLTSSYYSKSNGEIPKYVHDIFNNGLPADFRLVGATTRSPEEIPPALRSRCTEVFFRGLNASEVCEIAGNSFAKIKMEYELGVPELIAMYCSNGRDTVNAVQMCVSLAMLAGRERVGIQDVEEVVEYGHYSPNLNHKAASENKIGVANGLAVSGHADGMLMEIEAAAYTAEEKGKGSFKVTGIIEEEEINGRGGKMRRVSTAKSSVENAVTVIERYAGIKIGDYHIHLNFPGGMPVDGPSAGAAIFTALYSAITQREIPSRIAITGEISIKGRVCPVGGVAAKIEAAIESGVGKVFVPVGNRQKMFDSLPVEVSYVENVEELVCGVFGIEISHVG